MLMPAVELKIGNPPEVGSLTVTRKIYDAMTPYLGSSR
jgi:hypothetical protein